MATTYGPPALPPETVSEIIQRQRAQSRAAAPKVQLSPTGRHRIGDLLQDNWGNPLINSASRFTPKGQRLLALELPDHLSDSDRSAVLGFAAQHMGRFLAPEANRSMGGEPEVKGPTLQQVAEQHRGVNPAARFALQAAAGVEQVAPQPLSVRSDLIPQPKSAEEHIGRFAGQVGTFGLELAALRKLPFLGPAKTAAGAISAGATAARGAAAAALVTGAGRHPDLSSRVISSLVTGGTAGLSEYVPLKVFTAAITRAGEKLAPQVAEAIGAQKVAGAIGNLQNVPGMSEADQQLAARLATVAGTRAAGAARAVEVAHAAGITGAQRAAALTGAAVTPIIMGPLAAYSEYGLQKLTGHDVELPDAGDMVRNMGMMAAASLPGVAGAMRGVRVTPEQIEPLGGGETRPGEPGGPPRLGPGGITPPAEVQPFPAPANVKPAVDAIRRGVVSKFSTEPNPFAGGRTAEQEFNQRLTQNIQQMAAQRGVAPETFGPDEFRIAASKAASQVAGSQAIKQMMTLPPIPVTDPDAARKLNNQKDATAKANALMAGKAVTIGIPVATKQGVVRVPTDATIVRVEMAPHLQQNAVRVLVQEARGGKLVPMAFDNVEAMAKAMVFKPSAPASGEPVGRLTMSRAAVRPPGPTPPGATGEALAAAATSGQRVPPGPKALIPEHPISGKEVEPAWAQGREAIGRLTAAAPHVVMPQHAGAEAAVQWQQALEGARAAGVDIHPQDVERMRLKAKRTTTGKVERLQKFRELLTRHAFNQLERHIGKVSREAPKERPTEAAQSSAPPSTPPEEPPAQEAAKPAPTPPAPPAPKAIEPKGPKVGERVEVGEHKGVVIDQGEGRKTVLLDSGRTVQAAEAAVKPEAPKEITHYPSASRGGEPLRISSMAGSHLVNAEAKQPAGPLKEALRTEMGKRGIVPKEATSVEPKPAAPAAPTNPRQPGAAAGGGPVSGGAGGERNARARAPVRGEGGDRISVARSEFTEHVDESGVPEDLRGHLTAYQKQGAAKALVAMRDQARRAFLLADGTGVGKTRQILTVAETFRREGRLVVVFAPNEVLGKPWESKSLKASGGKPTATGSYAQDAAAMGISVNLWRPKDGPMPTSGIVLTTYTYMTDPAITENHNAVYVFDESHALKNASSGTRLAVKGRTLGNASYATLFASATPADKPTHIEYLARIGILEGKTLSKAVYDLGFRLAEKGGRTFWVPQKGIKTEEILKRMSALFDRMTQKGSMVKREIGLDGVDIHFRRLAMPREMHRTLQTIATHFDESNPRQRAIMLMHQRRQQEPEKAKVAMEIAKREIAAGRRVILFVSRVNFSEVQVTTGVDRSTGEKMRETIASSEGTAKLLRAMLQKEGIPFAELHGDADVHAGEAMASFQTGNAKVLVATVESGGTGINLDDTKGDAPRTLIMVTAPFNGVTNVQAAGRVWRMTTKSLPRIVYLFGDTPVDDWNAAIIAKKMETLGANVSGQVKRLLIDPDLLNETEPEDIGSLMSGEIGGEMTEPAPPAAVATPPEEPPPPEAGPPAKKPRPPAPPPPPAVEQALGTHEAEPMEWQRNEYDVEENQSPEQRESVLQEEAKQLRRDREHLAEIEQALARGGRTIEKGKKKGQIKPFTAKEREQLDKGAANTRYNMAGRAEEHERFEPGFREAVRARADADTRELAEIAALPESGYLKKGPPLMEGGKPVLDDEGKPETEDEWAHVQPTKENVDKYRWGQYGKAMVNGKEHDLADAVAYFKFGKFPWEMSQNEYDRWVRWAQGPDEYDAGRVRMDSPHVSAYHQIQAGLVDTPVETVGSGVYTDVMRGIDVFHAAKRGETIPESVQADYPWVRRVLPPGKQMSEVDVDDYFGFGRKNKKGTRADNVGAAEKKAAQAKIREKYGISERFNVDLEAAREEWDERRVEYKGEVYRVGFVDVGYDPATDSSFPDADLQAEYDYDDRSKRIDDVPVSELKKLPEPPDWNERDDRMARIRQQDEERLNKMGRAPEELDTAQERVTEAAAPKPKKPVTPQLPPPVPVEPSPAFKRAAEEFTGKPFKKATAPLQQETMAGLPPPQIPAGAKPTGPAPALELAGEAQTFEQAFDQLIKSGETPAFASLEAARISGQNEPDGFDAERAAGAIRRRLLEEAGQQDMFGNSPLLGAEGRVGVAGVPRGALEDIQTRPDIIGNGKPGVWDESIPVSEIGTHARFQNRDTRARLNKAGVGAAPLSDLVSNANVEQLYKAEKGFNPDLVRANPPLLWADTLGELGPANKRWLLSGHHRAFMWQQNMGEEPIPAKVMGGSLEHAERVAELSNRAGVSNTYSELARLAYTAAQKGEPDERTAAQLKVSEAELQRLRDFYNVDADLRAVYFPPGAENSIMETAFGSALGEQARKNPDVFTKQIQDDFLRRVMGSSDTPPLSVMQLRAAMADWKRKIADHLPQERAAELLAGGGGHISPSAWLAATERLTFDIQSSVADAHSTMVGIVNQYKSLFPPNSVPKKLTQAAVAKLLKDHRAVLPDHVRAVLKDIAAKLGELNAVEAEVEKRGRGLLQKIMDGTPIEDDLSAIKRFIVEKIGTPMRDAINKASRGGPVGSGFGALDPVVTWLLRRAAENTHKAAEAVMRRLGRKARTVYVRDHGTGNNLAKYELTMDPTTDPASEMALYRTGAVSGIMGSYVSMPPYARGEAIRMQAARDYLPDYWEQRLYEVMGDDFIRDVQQYYPGDAVAFDALENKDTPAAKAMLAKYERQYREARTLLNEIRDYVKQVSEAAGIEAPGFVENYAPHLFEGSFAKGIDTLAEFFHDRPMDEEEKRRLAKRFFDHREGDENYRRSFWLALRTYVRFSGHYVAKIRFLSHMKQLLSSEWSKGDPQRAAEVRRATVRAVWPQEDSMGRFINDATRAAFWSRVAGGVDQITPQQAALYLGREREEVAREMIGEDAANRFAYVLKGVKPNFTDPRKWKKLGDTKHGAVYAGTGGHAFGPAHSELMPWIQKMLDMGLELKVRADKRVTPEDALASMLRQRDRSTRLSRSPGNYLVSWIGRRISRALVGLSAATTIINFTGLLTHVYTRYGALSMLRGGARFAAGSSMSAVRGLAAYLEHHSLIDPKLASAIYRSTPFMREQLLLEAGGLKQGFSQSLEKMLEKIEAGQHNIDVRIGQLAGNWMMGAELIIRGWSVMAAADAAESRGHTWGDVGAWVGRSGADRNRAIMDLMGQLSNPKSVISYVAENEYFTNFFYNQLGQNPGMGMPWFKTILGLFSTFPWSSLVHKEVRGMLGASRAVSATINSALGRTPAEKPMRGSVQGANYDVPRMAPREPYGGRNKGDPFGPFAEFFRRGGMSYFDRQAAIEFARSMFVTGALAVAGSAMGINALVAYAPYAFLLALAVLKMFFPDNDELVKALKNAEAGTAFRAGHGGLVAGAPVINAIEQTRAGDSWGQVLWNATLGRMGDLARMALLGPIYRSSRGVLEQNPEVFDTDELRWLYDAFGVKSALYDLTPQQKALRTLGILDEQTAAEHRQYIHPRESKSAGPPRVPAYAH